jgi:hypothetical protein
MHLKNRAQTNAYPNTFAAKKTQLLRDNWDMEYLGLVSVGTPMQTFKGLI